MAIFRFEQLTIDAVTAQPVLAQVGGQSAQSLRLTAGAVSIRYRYDGVDPTPTVGHLVAAGAQFDLDGGDAIRQLRLIATATTSMCSITRGAP